MMTFSFTPCWREIRSPNYPDETMVFHKWCKDGVEPTCVVFMLHGLHAHGRYATVAYGTEAFQYDGSAVIYSFDLPGHGKGKGTAGLLRSASEAILNALTAARYLQSCHPDLPMILCGTSMGAAIAIGAAVENQKLVESKKFGSARNNPTHGRNGEEVVAALDCGALPALNLLSLVLVAPLIGVNDKDIPHPIVFGFLKMVSNIVPSLAVITSKASDPTLQYKDPDRRTECLEDPLLYNGKLRLGSAASLLELCQRNQDSFGGSPPENDKGSRNSEEKYAPDANGTAVVPSPVDVETGEARKFGSNILQTPFLILAAEAEKVVDPDKARVMMDTTVGVPSNKKKYFLVPEALHGIWCEFEENRNLCKGVVKDWMNERLQEWKGK